MIFMAIIQNDKHSIGDLFNNRNPFIIPKHQRAYSWEDEEVQAFCNDIDEISDEEEYFFGGVVSVHQHATNGPGRIYRVVDGQQRLATFTMLISQLRNGYKIIEFQANEENDSTNKDTAKSLAEDLYNIYLTYNDTRKKPPIRENRLTLSKVDSDFFKELLNNSSLTITAESHKRILHAWENLFEKLIKPIVYNESISLSDKLDQLNLLKDKVLEQSVIIHIVCDNLDEAYQLFEVLNDRGKELAIGDYLRSTTLEILDDNPTTQNTVAELWDDILARQNAEKFIKSYLASHVATIPKSNVHRQFQKKFFKFNDITEEAQITTLNRVQNIKSTFDIYEYLIDGVWPYSTSGLLAWEKNRLNLLIKQLEHKLCIPLLLAVYEVGNESDLLKVVIALEKVVFRYISVSNLRANNLSQIYKRHILNMRRDGEFQYNDFKNDLIELLDTACNDSLFTDSIISNLTYQNKSRNRKKIRYFLTTLEDYTSWYTSPSASLPPRAQMNVITNIDSVEIEHIYPQNAIQNIEALESLKHSIGNLTYWSPSDNKSASNLEFQNKKTHYSSSNVSLTRRLAELDEWNESSVTSTQQLYIDMAKSIFTIY